MSSQEQAVVRADAPETSVGFTTSASFELMQRGAKLLAASSLVPKEFQGNLPNTCIALNLANRLGADPLMVMQNLYVVHGRPGWSSSFLVASFNQCGRFSSIRYEFFGDPGTDSWGCRAWATEKATGERLVGADITIALSKKEGWYNKQGSKWQTMPQQMLMYRAAAWFVRAYAPEIAMGLKTIEEVWDSGEDEKNVTAVGQVIEKIPNGPPVDPPPASKLDAIVAEAEKAKGNGGNGRDKAVAEVERAPLNQTTTGDLTLPPADDAMKHAKETMRRKKAKESPPAGNPEYSEYEEPPTFGE